MSKKKIFNLPLFKEYHKIKNVYRYLTEESNKNSLKKILKNITFFKFIWYNYISCKWITIMIKENGITPDATFIFRKHSDYFDIPYFVVEPNDEAIKSVKSFFARELSKLAVYNKKVVLIRLHEDNIDSIELFENHLCFELERKSFFASQMDGRKILLYYKYLNNE